MSNFSELDKTSLQCLLKEKGIKGYSKMNKNQMIEALNSVENPQPVPQPVSQPVPQPVPQQVSQPVPQPVPHDEYYNLTTRQLRDLLRIRGVSGALSEVNKTDLIKMLKGELVTPERKARTESTTWNRALQEFNKDRQNYIMPKKNTSEYTEVMKIKERLENEQLKKKSSKA